MEKLSNQNKKELFYGLIKQCPNGFKIGSYHQKAGDAMYEAGYWDYNWKIKNNGILGLRYGGITEDGKKIVSLTVGGALDEAPFAGIRDGNLIKQFDDDSQLDEFLDRFFDMNNMEAINEFAPDSKAFQEEELYTGCYPNDFPLEYLYMLDCLNEEFEGSLLDRNVYASEYTGEKIGPNSTVRINLNYDDIILDISERIDEYKSKWTTAKYNSNDFGSANMEIVEDEIQDPNKTNKIVEICQKAIADFPQVYQAIRNGTYTKNNRSTLQQREEELSALETEEKTISEAEALIDKQSEKEGQDIGE